jgi:hypothetical protein
LNDPLNPVALRLESIEEAILRYYLKHRVLPGNVDELDLGTATPFTSPYNGKPLVYEPDGVPVMIPAATSNHSATVGKAVVWEADASYPGFRWAILIEPSARVSLLQSKVVAVPERQLLEAIRGTSAQR